MQHAVRAVQREDSFLCGGVMVEPRASIPLSQRVFAFVASSLGAS